MIMYRLINATTTSFVNTTKLSINLFKRNQSTVPNPNVKRQHKKRVKRRKFYDLLIVTDNSTKQQKATIQKLTSNDLKLLASTNLSLGELYKLKDISTDYTQHTYNNLAVIDNVSLKDPEECQEKLAEPEMQPDETTIDIDEIPVYNSLQPEIPDEPETEPPPNVSQTPKNKRRNQEIAHKTLASYVEICSNLNQPQRGLKALYFHNMRASKHNGRKVTIIKNIDVYNALLKGFANTANLQKIEEILKIVRDEHIRMNPQTFVAIFECLGRLNRDGSHLKQIRIYRNEAVQNGCDFNRIMNEGSFLNKSRNYVLKAFNAYDPQYQPQYKLPETQYKNHLVDHLNDPVQLGGIQLDAPETPGIFDEKWMERQIKRQIELEKAGVLTVKSVESRAAPSDDVLHYRAVLDEHFKMWEDIATKAFNRDLCTLTAQKSPLNYEPYMRCIPVKEYVQIIVDEARKIAEGSETYSPTVAQLHRELGRKVYARYKVLRKQKTGVLDKILDIHGKFCENYTKLHGKLDVIPENEIRVNTRQMWQWHEYECRNTLDGVTLNMDHREWNMNVLQSIGGFLYHIVMHDLRVDVNAMRINSKHRNHLPAFYTIFRTQGRIVKEEVKPHPVLSRLYRASIPETLTFPVGEVPMYCPPIPWTSIDNGGYLVSPCDVVRLPNQAMLQKQRMRDCHLHQLYPTFDALNQLGAVPWQVNQPILDVILHVFNNGGSSRLDIPETPTKLTPPPAPSGDLDKNQRYQLFKQRLQFKRKKAEMYSLWCDCLYRLSLANHYRNDIFWLPHNMDFRGRVYPIPPHLNHLGSDLARAMLVFAESRPLGPHGLDWLKLHLINLIGTMKREPIHKRLIYANEIIDKIMDSADRPLDGAGWWMDSDEPWQTLACCMEITNAIRSGNPDAYKSHFPVHQDGSCNGLQHYAALGRDSAGAYSVNLSACERPQDVYSAVVNLVESQRAIDAQNGVEIARHLAGFVSRKVIKQTVMTTVYGVTRYGARLQIARQLKDLNGFPKDHVWSASNYLTARTFDSLTTMFTSARVIQDWFTDCARFIASVGGQYVEWITPMGLPIVQPYYRHKTIQSKLTGNLYKSYHIDKYEKPNVMKQKNAFPPNFIHSLDSSHMMLTSLHCERQGITFVSVHDCYWTHPSTVHIMNKICREQFVALHSEPILENLSMFLSEKYSYQDEELSDDGSVTDLTRKKLNRILRKLPQTGDFDIKQVLDSVYFFS